MNTSYKVSAAIVTYNRLELLKESLAAVLAQNGEYLSHVIVINNNSTDGTADYLATINDPKIIVKNLTANVGGAGGFNVAVREFGENTTDDAIWLMDDDTVPQKDALSVLVDFIKANPETSFVNSNVRWQRANGEPSWMNVVAPKSFTWPTTFIGGQQVIEVMNSTFVSVMIPRQIISQIGLPQQEYFIWGDDIEYTNRAAKIYPGYFLAESIVVHKSQNNDLPGNIVKENDVKRLWRYDYEFRNRLLTARREGGIGMLLKKILVSGRDLVLVLFQPRVTYRWRKVRSIVGGTFRGIFFHPKIQYLDEQKS